jgi:hypothetical protein
MEINEKGDPTMLTPMSAQWLAGRVTPTQDRDAQQLADVRSTLQRKSQASAVERLQALFSRSQAPSAANCDCTA